MNRIKSLMKMICVNVGINMIDRKIVPHTGRKTMVQALESLGETTLNIRKQSRHRSDESLRPYLSTGEKEQLHMMEKLAESLTGDNSKSRSSK
jgi:integrase